MDSSTPRDVYMRRQIRPSLVPIVFGQSNYVNQSWLDNFITGKKIQLDMYQNKTIFMYRNDLDIVCNLATVLSRPQRGLAPVIPRNKSIGIV